MTRPVTRRPRPGYRWLWRLVAVLLLLGLLLLTPATAWVAQGDALPAQPLPQRVRVAVYLIINYAALVTIIGSTVGLILVTDTGRRTQAERLCWVLLAASPGGWLVLQFVSAVFL